MSDMKISMSVSRFAEATAFFVILARVQTHIHTAFITILPVSEGNFSGALLLLWGFLQFSRRASAHTRSTTLVSTIITRSAKSFE